MKRHTLKRLIIISVLIVGLLCMAIPSAALAYGGPTLKVSPSSGSVPDVVRVYGKYWDSGAVAIYVDPQEIWTRYGAFDSTIHLPAMSVGPHEIVAVQGATQKTVIYTVKCAPALDDRIKDEIKDIKGVVDNIQYTVNLIWDKLGNVQSTVNLIWAKLGNVQDTVNLIWAKLGNVQDTVNLIWAKLGNVQDTVNLIWTKLGNVQSTVNIIHDEVTDGVYGLEEIKTEVANIETDLNLKLTLREISGVRSTNASTTTTLYEQSPTYGMCIVHAAVSANPWVWNNITETTWIQAWVDYGDGYFLARSVDAGRPVALEFPAPDGKYKIVLRRGADAEGPLSIKYYIIEEIREGDLP